MSKDTSGPAFPVSGADYKEGMTLRDYFAAKAMHGLISFHGFARLAINSKESIHEEISRKSYAMADEMIKAREA